MEDVELFCTVHVLPNKASMLRDNSRHLPETEVTTSSVKAKKHTHNLL